MQLVAALNAPAQGTLHLLEVVSEEQDLADDLMQIHYITSSQAYSRLCRKRQK